MKNRRVFRILLGITLLMTLLWAYLVFTSDPSVYQ